MDQSTMSWSGEYRGFVIEAFFKNDSVTGTHRAFRTPFELYATDAVPDRKTTLGWVSNVRASGSALPRKPSGRPRNVRTPENVQRVRASIEQSPRRSARKHATALGISDRNVRRILNTYLRMHPYKMMVAQELNVTDWETRRTLSEYILQHVPPTAVLWCSDEAHFHLSGTVKKQTFRYWAENNPRDLHQRPLHRPWVTVWCAVSRLGVVGPYFFEEGGETVTVTSNRYCEMLENFLRPRLEEFDDSEDVWFQQDGATAHSSSFAGNFERNVPKSTHLLTRRYRVARALPDLTPAIFSCGDTSRPRFINIGLKPSKHLRTLFVRKLPPFPQRWPTQRWKTLENGFGSSSRITAATWVMLFPKPNEEKTRL